MSLAAGAWFNPLREWLPALIGALQRERAIVRVVLAEVRGSAPREAGVGMLVGETSFEGTIGGGQLEWEALGAARELLAKAAPAAKLHRIVLAADVGQCCGGVVQVWIERFDAADLQVLREASAAAQRGSTTLVTNLSGRGLQRQVVAGALADATTTVRIRHHGGDAVELLERLDVSYPPLWLYGGGHVGQALVRILADLPLQLTWIDSRSAIFPPQAPATVRLLHSAEPLESVAAAPAGTRYLVMTHSHALDFALCRAILSRADFAWAGLIGSKSKAARFRSRLTRAGISADAVERLVCPIGIGGIDSKWPAAIAVAVAAELLRDISGVAAKGSRTAASAEPSVATACSTPRCAGCETS